MLPLRHLIHGTMAVALAMTTVSAAEPPTPPNANQNDQNKTTSEKITSSDAHLEDALAHWLMEGNKFEVEIAQLAEQRASDPAVKDFAQRMIKAHTGFWNKLSKFTNEKEQTLTATDRPIFQKEFHAPGKPNENAAPVKRRVGFRGNKHPTMDEIGKRAGQMKTQMTKELLKKYEGRDFDMAYLGDQIAAHISMLATLKAIEESTTGEFQKVVKEGIDTTESHLQRAKELSGQLQQGRGAAGRSNNTNR